MATTLHAGAAGLCETYDRYLGSAPDDLWIASPAQDCLGKGQGLLANQVASGSLERLPRRGPAVPFPILGKKVARHNHPMCDCVDWEDRLEWSAQPRVKKFVRWPEEARTTEAVPLELTA